MGYPLKSFICLKARVQILDGMSQDWDRELFQEIVANTFRRIGRVSCLPEERRAVEEGLASEIVKSYQNILRNRCCPLVCQLNSLL